MSEVIEVTSGGELPVSPVRGSLFRHLLRSPLAVFALVMLVIVIVAAVFAPVLAPYAPDSLRIDMVNAPPGHGYLLGGDGAGRDILSRLLWASRNTLVGALIGVSVAAVLGVIAGLLGGYYGHFLDSVFTWATSIFMAMPTMVVLLAVFQAVGAQIMWAMVAFGVMLSPGFYRLVRNQVMGVKNELYVDAARVSGLTDARIIGRHILLVVRAPVVIQAAHVAGLAITMQSGLEFLGLGNPKSPTWGGMLQNGFQNIYNAPTAIIWPGLAIAFTVASLMLLGNAVRDAIQRSGEASVGKRPRHTASSSTRESGSNRPSSVATVTTSSAGEISTTPGDGGRVGDEVLLSVRDLTIGYPHGEGFTKVVENVSLDVRQGEVLGLVGESGSGKTQTVFAVLGLLPSGGTILDGSSIRFAGRELTGLAEREYEKLRGRRLAYVPQEPMSNLDPCYRVGYQLVEPMRRHLGLGSRAARSRALDLLDRVGIPDPQRTFMAYPHEVSGGMAQRVLIAGAVSCNPELLIADEPTTALDVTVQAEVLDLLRDLQAEFNMSVLLVTHNFGVVADICHRVAVMQLGHVVETNDVMTLFAEPQHPYTRMLLDSTLEGSTPRAYQPVLGGLR